MSLILAQATPLSPGTGLEIMIPLALILPVVLLIFIIWLGHKNTI